MRRADTGEQEQEEIGRRVSHYYFFLLRMLTPEKSHARKRARCEKVILLARPAYLYLRYLGQNDILSARGSALNLA